MSLKMLALPRMQDISYVVSSLLSFDSWRVASSDASSQLSKWIKAESRHYQCFEET